MDLYSILQDAAGNPGTESEKREIYRTADLIGEGSVQETLVETWARIVGCWYDDALGFFLAHGIITSKLPTLHRSVRPFYGYHPPCVDYG